MNNTIILIDGSSFIFRAFYAIKNLTAPDGTPTNAVYGVINMLKLMQKKYSTPHWVCVFDAKGKTFRDDLYPEYKANRRETPAELVPQFPLIHKIIQDLGISVVIEPGVEADDVIATIAKKYEALDYKILIATGDKDFAQLVNHNITLINTMTNELLDPAGVFNKFGVNPQQIVDYLSLIGDNVDNVPGVAKCGPKTAAKWLNQYGSIDNLIIKQQELTGVVGENFRATIDWLTVAKKLITIDTQVNINTYDINQLNNFKLKAPNKTELITIFKQLNFKTWLKELELDKTQEFNLEPNLLPTHKTKFSLKLISITDTSTIKNFIANYNQQMCLVLPFVHLELTHLAIISQTEGLIINFVLPQEGLFINQEDLKLRQTSFHLLQNYFNQASACLVFDLKVTLYHLATHNLSIQNISDDLRLIYYLLNSKAANSLDDILLSHGLIQDTELSANLLGRGVKQIAINDLAISDQEAFFMRLANWFNLYQQLKSQLNANQLKLYLNCELPLSRVLYQVEKNGILLDASKLQELSFTLHLKIKALEEKIFYLVKSPFNINSPKQLAEILFNRLKLPTLGVRKNSNTYSTNEETLILLQEQGFGIAELLLSYRELSKLLNTYVDKLATYQDKVGRIHTTFLQMAVISGRLSSKEPNLQNIPIRGSYGQKIRECFIAKKGCSLICADYSQIELRVLAHISDDSNMQQAFIDEMDIHAITASQIFNKDLKAVTKEERRYAKSINFGLMYGKGVYGLAKELNIERTAAKEYIDSYFARFPKILKYMDEVKALAHQNGFVESLYGRRVYLNNINSSNKILMAQDERLALNAPMQATAADIIKFAMLNIANYLNNNHLQTKMVLQIHDELIFEAPETEIDLVFPIIKELMRTVVSLKVPLTVDIQKANSWGLVD